MAAQGDQLAIPDQETPKMEESFRQLLYTNGMPKTLVDLMERENILCAADLPRYCWEGKQKIWEYLVQMCEETRGNRKYMPFLIKVHDEAEAANSEAASRKAKGTDDEEIEKPLPDHDKAVDALNARHKAAYGYRLGPD